MLNNFFFVIVGMCKISLRYSGCDEKLDGIVEEPIG